MKKIQFIIEFTDPISKETDYAILFEGIATRKYLYVKQTSWTGREPMPYIRVKRADTQVLKIMESAANVEQMREIIMSSDAGDFKDDPRVTVLKGTEDIIKEVDVAIKEIYKKKAKAS